MAYQIFLESRPSQRSSYLCSDFARLIERSVGFTFPVSVHKVVFKTLQRLHKKVRNTKNRLSYSEVLEKDVLEKIVYDRSEAECSLVENLSEEEPEPEVEVDDDLECEKFGAKRSRQCVLHVSTKQQKRRLDPAYEEFCETAESEGITPTQLAGLFISRYSWMNDRTMTDLGERLAYGKGVQPSKLSTESAALIMADAEIGKSAYCKIASILKREGFDILPGYADVSQFNKKVTPVAKALQQPHTGIEFPLYPAVKMSFERTLLLIPDKLDSIVSSGLIKYSIKAGFDGSGSHSIFNQKGNMETNNIIMTMMCPLSIQTEDNVILWKEENPESSNTHRPLALQLGKETIESLKSFADLTEVILQLETTGFQSQVKEEMIRVKVQIRLTAMDRKACDAVTGLGGAFCDLCFLSKEEAHNLSKVPDIKVERTLESTQQICEQIPVKEDGDLVTARGDYEQRKGVKRAPTTKKEVESIQALHMLLRSTDWLLKLVYHESAGVNHWSESVNNRDLQFLKNAKKEVQVYHSS